MNLGFACLLDDNTRKNTGDKYKVNRTLTVKKALTLSKNERYDTIKTRTRSNFYGLLNMVQYLIKNNYKIYRISSNMIVLDNHECNSYIWHEDDVIINLCEQIKQLCKNNNIRLTSHPDHYNPIATAKKEVFEKVVRNLTSEAKLMDMIGGDTMCVHVGSKQGGKESGLKRFISNFKKLPENVRNLIAIENDDKSYNLEDVLLLAIELGIPVIPDLHHDRINVSTSSFEEMKDMIIETWSLSGRRPKCHLSSGRESKLDRKHSDIISLDDWFQWSPLIHDFDVIIECKHKNKSVELIKSIDNNI